MTTDTVSGPDGEVTLTAPAAIGALLTDLARGPMGRWDKSGTFDIYMPGIDLAAVDDLALLAGENRFAVQTETGWETLQARNIELISINTYRLGTFLRGLAGTDADMMDVVPSGARIVFLGQGFADLPISNDHLGDQISLTATAAGRESDPVSTVYSARHLRPLSPVHGIAQMIEGGLNLSWIRRTRTGGETWAGIDVPLGEAREFYRAEFVKDDIVITSFESAEPRLSVSAASLQSIGAYDKIRISQGSDAFGYGPALVVLAD